MEVVRVEGNVIGIYGRVNSSALRQMKKEKIAAQLEGISRNYQNGNLCSLKKKRVNHNIQGGMLNQGNSSNCIRRRSISIQKKKRKRVKVQTRSNVFNPTTQRCQMMITSPTNILHIQMNASHYHIAFELVVHPVGLLRTQVEYLRMVMGELLFQVRMMKAIALATTIIKVTYELRCIRT